MSISIGIPVFNRYDLLALAIKSCMNSNKKPDKICIIDNGGKIDTNLKIDFDLDIPINILRPEKNLGTAGGWNEIIKNTEDYRLIINDDIQFFPDTIEKMINKMENGAEFVWTCRPFGVLNGFSCFGIQNSLIEKIGFFDENISPSYSYYEDGDYHYRMFLAGITEVDSEAEAIHFHSATLKAFSPEEMAEHHRKFALAQSNYIKKWGGMPLQETFRTPYGR